MRKAEKTMQFRISPYPVMKWLEMKMVEISAQFGVIGKDSASPREESCRKRIDHTSQNS